jgi:type II secretory pathway pseudopilin PulG
VGFGGRRPFYSRESAAFSLVEVVLALGIMVFGVVVVIGLLSVVLQTTRESRDQMGAADAASHIIAVRRAEPTNSLANVFLPAVNQDWDSPPATGGSYISDDGAPATAASATFYATYHVGTNAGTGTRAGNIDISLFWPAGASTNAQSHYEVFTTVSW